MNILNFKKIIYGLEYLKVWHMIEIDIYVFKLHN